MNVKPNDPGLVWRKTARKDYDKMKETFARISVSCRNFEPGTFRSRYKIYRRR